MDSRSKYDLPCFAFTHTESVCRHEVNPVHRQAIVIHPRRAAKVTLIRFCAAATSTCWTPTTARTVSPATVPVTVTIRYTTTSRTWRPGSASKSFPDESRHGEKNPCQPHHRHQHHHPRKRPSTLTCPSLTTRQTRCPPRTLSLCHPQQPAIEDSKEAAVITAHPVQQIRRRLLERLR